MRSYANFNKYPLCHSGLLFISVQQNKKVIAIISIDCLLHMLYNVLSSILTNIVAISDCLLCENTNISTNLVVLKDYGLFKMTEFTILLYHEFYYLILSLVYKIIRIHTIA